MADKDQTDVVAIPTELSVKHPLQNQWVLWFDNPVKRLGAKDWSQNLKKVLAFLPIATRFTLQKAWGRRTFAVVQRALQSFFCSSCDMLAWSTGGDIRHGGGLLGNLQQYPPSFSSQRGLELPLV
jgi:hypothetical protein